MAVAQFSVVRLHTMDTLATYKQRFGFARRLFTLYSDRLVVHSRRMGSSSEVIYDLAALKPQCDRARVRTQGFYGGCIALLAAIACFVSLIINHGLVLPAVLLVSAMGLVGIVGVIYRAKPLRVFMFKNRDGVYAFEIVGAGPDARGVEQFAATVSQQIQKIQSAA